jgi:hypothetical protein
MDDHGMKEGRKEGRTSDLDVCPFGLIIVFYIPISISRDVFIIQSAHAKLNRYPVH